MAGRWCPAARLLLVLPVAHAVVADRLRTWMEDLVIPMPAGKGGDLPMGLGRMNLTGGECWGLKVGALETEDNSSGPMLGLVANVTGIEIGCSVEAVMDDGTMFVNITLASSSLQAAILVEPHSSEVAPSMPLPLGRMTLTHCLADIVVANISMAGTSFVASSTSMFEPDMLAGMVGGFINDPLCDAMRAAVEVQGGDMAAMGAGMLSYLLLPPPEMEAPAALRPAMDWAEYPPAIVSRVLLAERFGLWVGRISGMMDRMPFGQALVSTGAASLTLRDVSISGAHAEEQASMDFVGAGQHIGVAAHMRAIAFSAALDLNVTAPGQPALSERFVVTLGLDSFSLGLRAHVDKHRLGELGLDQAMQFPRCAVDCAGNMTNPAHDALALDRIAVDLRPLFELGANGTLEVQIVRLVNTVVAALYAGYLPALNALTNSGLDMARNLVNDRLWAAFDALPACREAESEIGVGGGLVTTFWVQAAVVAIFGAVVAILYHVHAKRGAAAARRLPGAASAAAAAPAPEDVALWKHPLVPRGLAVFYPIASVAVMLLFVYADFGLAATVAVRMRATSGETEFGPIFSFSLMSTIVHSWHGEAYFIAIATVLMSGLWPFVKLAMLLVAWLAPPRRFSIARRARALKFLDTLGKYSFIDSWFLVLSMSAFAIEWRAESDPDAALALQTNPCFAFYAFFVATGASLLLGHVASEYHTEILTQAAAQQRREMAKAAEAPAQEAELRKISLASLSSSRALRWGGSAALFTTLLLTVVGSLLPSIEFHVNGIFADFMFGETIHARLSLWDTGANVSTGRESEFGLIVLETVFLVLSVVLPVVLLAMLMVLWVAPMTAQSQERLLRASYFVESWTTIDVAVVVMLIACFEFSRLSEFLVYRSDFASACIAFRDATQSECMTVELEALPPLFLLIVAGALNIAVPKLAIRFCAAATAQRLHHAVLALPEHDMARLSTTNSSKVEELAAAPVSAGQQDIMV